MKAKSLVTIVSTFLFAAFPGSMTKPAIRLQGSGRTTVSVPLEYRLILKEPTVCSGEALEFEIEVRNISDHPVTIDPPGLLYEVSTRGNHEASGSVSDPMSVAGAAKFVELRPGDAFRKTIAYPMKTSLSNRAGFYHLSTTYASFKDADPEHPALYKGLIRSNEVIFEIKDCDTRP